MGTDRDDDGGHARGQHQGDGNRLDPDVPRIANELQIERRHRLTS